VVGGVYLDKTFLAEEFSSEEKRGFGCEKGAKEARRRYRRRGEKKGPIWRDFPIVGISRGVVVVVVKEKRHRGCRSSLRW